MTLRNKLLVMLLALLLVRALVVPLSEWQSETRTLLENKLNHITKIEQLLQSSDEFAIYEANLAQVKQDPAVVKAVRVITSIDDYKLTVQQEIQAEVTAVGARTELFDWIMNVQSETSELGHANIAIRIFGKPAAIAKFQYWLDQQSNIKCDNLTFGWSTFLNDTADVTASFNLTVQYQLQDAVNEGGQNVQ